MKVVNEKFVTVIDKDDEKIGDFRNVKVANIYLNLKNIDTKSVRYVDNEIVHIIMENKDDAEKRNREELRASAEAKLTAEELSALQELYSER